ncbi:C-type lectin-like 7 [Homarus americanus]|uniref:C-type lectin-like 7 n=1 Tax=Homarus americanus TaxID=6706 RepID=A0A8J5TNE6_HOMAM|nr:C-type lectin-like 7 [Homarus americanus]
MTSSQAGRLTDHRASRCPDPFEILDDVHCILIDPFIARTYSEALAFCKSHGGQLVAVETDDLINIYDYINEEEFVMKQNYWLGASDAAKEGSWLWEHNKGQVPMGVPYWHYGEPNNGNTYNCAILHVSYNHRWVDVPCTSKYMTICLRTA